MKAIRVLMGYDPKDVDDGVACRVEITEPLKEVMDRVTSGEATPDNTSTVDAALAALPNLFGQLMNVVMQAATNDDGRDLPARLNSIGAALGLDVEAAVESAAGETVH